MRTPQSNLLIAALVAGLLLLAPSVTKLGAACDAAPIFNGPQLDYQPSIVRLDNPQRLLVVFERLDPATQSGDLLQVSSTDNGLSWSAPAPAIVTSHSERHPAVVVLSDDSLAMFYLSDAEGPGAYRIHRAVSDDGQRWESTGVIDLGWSTAGEINPSVVIEHDDVMTMAYHRLRGPSYVARSSDLGVSWDQRRTRITAGSSALPRIARRDSDGQYVVTYQTNPGNNSLNLWAQMAVDPYDWSAAPIPVSVGRNTHDSVPLYMPDGRLLVFYARQIDQAFDLFYRAEAGSDDWADEVRLTANPERYDTQPHPIVEEGGATVMLVWPRQDDTTSSPYSDHDVWVRAGLNVAEPPDVLPAYLPVAYAESGM